MPAISAAFNAFFIEADVLTLGLPFERPLALVVFATGVVDLTEGVDGAELTTTKTQLGYELQMKKSIICFEKIV